MHRIIRKSYEELIQDKKNEIEKLNKEKEQTIQNVKNQMEEKRKIEKDKIIQSTHENSSKRKTNDIQLKKNINNVISESNKNESLKIQHTGKQMVKFYLSCFFGIICVMAIFYFNGFFI